MTFLDANIKKGGIMYIFFNKCKWLIAFLNILLISMFTTNAFVQTNEIREERKTTLLRAISEYNAVRYELRAVVSDIRCEGLGQCERELQVLRDTLDGLSDFIPSENAVRYAFDRGYESISESLVTSLQNRISVLSDLYEDLAFLANRVPWTQFYTTERLLRIRDKINNINIIIYFFTEPEIVNNS